MSDTGQLGAGYEAAGQELARRIEALIPDNPQILTLESVWDLLEVPGFRSDDLQPTLAMAGAALSLARSRWRARHVEPAEAPRPCPATRPAATFAAFETQTPRAAGPRRAAKPGPRGRAGPNKPGAGANHRAGAACTARGHALFWCPRAQSGMSHGDPPMPRARLGADSTVLAAALCLALVGSCASCDRDPAEPDPRRPELRKPAWDDPVRAEEGRRLRESLGLDPRGVGTGRAVP